jgi:hypothetical protein
MAAVKKATWILAGKQRTSLVWTGKGKPMMWLLFTRILYESWPMAITSLLLAAAFTVLIVIYSMMWLLYLNPTKADQWPSQACCWLQLIPFYLLFIL